MNSIQKQNNCPREVDLLKNHLYYRETYITLLTTLHNTIPTDVIKIIMNYVDERIKIKNTECIKSIKEKIKNDNYLLTPKAINLLDYLLSVFVEKVMYNSILVAQQKKVISVTEVQYGLLLLDPNPNEIISKAIKSGLTAFHNYKNFKAEDKKRTATKQKAKTILDPIKVEDVMSKYYWKYIHRYGKAVNYNNTVPITIKSVQKITSVYLTGILEIIIEEIIKEASIDVKIVRIDNILNVLNKNKTLKYIFFELFI